MADYFKYEIDVPPEAVDANGHVNNVVYVQWMQDAAVNHYNSEGCRPVSDALGATWFIRKHTVEYKQPSFPGDRISVYTWLVKITTTSTQRRYAFVRTSDGALLVRGETMWVFVDAATGRPKSIPDEIRARFTEMPEDWLPPA
jgi:acyl-CoA thioester hydrolase